MNKINQSNPDDKNTNGGHKNRSVAARILVGSQLPSDVRRGLAQLRSFLNEDNEDSEVYEILLLAINNNPSYRDEVLNLIKEHEQRGSRAAGEIAQKLAQQAINADSTDSRTKDMATVPVKKQALVDDADDAYYAAEFGRAIQLYRQVLSQEPNNQRARQQLDKAELNQLSKKAGQNLRREAMQYYRRARSFIAARDVKSAISMLNAAIEEARSHGKSFPEAEDLLASQHNLEVAVEIKQEADAFITNAQWEQALERYESVLNLDPTDELARDPREKIKELLEAEALLLSLTEPLELQDRKGKLENIAQTIGSAEKIYNIAKSDRFRILRARHRIYKAEFDFQVSRFKSSAKKQLMQTLSTTQDVLDTNDPAVKYVNEQLANNGRSFFPFWILLITILAVVGISVGGWRFITNMISETPVNTKATMTLTPSLMLSLTPTLTLTKSNLITSSSPSTVTPSNVLTPTPSPAIMLTLDTVQETAYVTNIAVAHYFDEPNGSWQGEITRNLFVTVLDKELVSGFTWYLCEWEKDDQLIKGWILGDYLSFDPTPTPIK